MSTELDLDQTAKLIDYIGYASETFRKVAEVQNKLDQAQREVEETAEAVLATGWVAKQASAKLKQVLSSPDSALRFIRAMAQQHGTQKTAQALGQPASPPRAPEPTQSRNGRGRTRGSTAANDAFSAILDQLK